VSRAWGAVALHHEYWSGVAPRVVSDGIVIVDRGVFQGDIGRDDVTIVEIDATNTAIDLGSVRGASMVALGALSAATNIVSVDALVAATAEVLPPYRSQHAAANAAAVRAGYELVDGVALPAWTDVVASEAGR
jgi:Pyruvate/2-oxoacid:ferredoxin oxidoreductase gamma subunit